MENPRMKFTSVIGTAAATVVLSLACAVPAHAALQARDIGNTGATNAFYDTTLNVTWLDMASGALNWNQANTWASNLNVGGVTGWRLPTMTVANPDPSYSYDGSTATGYNVPGSSSEMASLFFNTLGNMSTVNTLGGRQMGAGLANTGGFQNLQSSVYWLGTEYVRDPSSTWIFLTSYGRQNYFGKDNQYSALAVHSGDVAPVPEPETYAMLLLGLGVVGAISRRRSRAHGSLAIQVN